MWWGQIEKTAPTTFTQLSRGFRIFKASLSKGQSIIKSQSRIIEEKRVFFYTLMGMLVRLLEGNRRRRNSRGKGIKIKSCNQYCNQSSKNKLKTRTGTQGKYPKCLF
jgi:hypothetical protein